MNESIALHPAVQPADGVPWIGDNPRSARRVLLIAYHYPPSRESGALRPRGLAKYLAEFGWDVTVLTASMPGTRPGNVIQTDSSDAVADWKRRLRLRPDRGLKDQLQSRTSGSTQRAATTLINEHLVDLGRWLLTYPDPRKGWERFAVAAAERLRGQGIEAIISTAPPLVCHMIAGKAKQFLGCPWIADYRDLWNTDPLTLEDRSGVVGAIQRRTEKRILASCDALVTVSEPWAHRLRLRYPGKKAHAITNGFDPDEMAPADHSLTSKFSITHAGILYLGKRDPTPLLQALRDLINAGQMDASDLLLRFYGEPEPFLSPLIRKFGLERVTEMRAVPRGEVLERQRESQLLLVLNWSGPTENGGHTGKVFEYLAASRPILACGGAPGVLRDLLQETNTGVHVLSQDQMRQVLLDAYREYKRHGRVLYRGNDNAIERYSHRNMAQKFAGLLEEVAPRQVSLRSTESVQSGC
ncbi:MAG TPA: glycosyltransferase family 4 protein [Terriglobales bacterium]|nr:glycosyltransferase family 4 protein [Terriglobales bacterium]